MLSNVRKLYKNGSESKNKNPVLSRVFNLDTDIEVEYVWLYKEGRGYAKKWFNAFS